MAMLEDHKEELKFSASTRWSKVKDAMKSDPRYKGVESSSKREDIFRDFIDQQYKVYFRSCNASPILTGVWKYNPNIEIGVHACKTNDRNGCCRLFYPSFKK